MKEIERKFLLESLPNITVKGTSYERYFLQIGKEREERIQKKGDKFEREIKMKQGEYSYKKIKETISKQEFEELKGGAIGCIQRKSYNVSSKPDISIKIYEGIYNGLIRVEVEFENEVEAQNYEKPDWMGIEITHTRLGKDSELIQLEEQEFRKLLGGYMKDKKEF